MFVIEKLLFVITQFLTSHSFNFDDVKILALRGQCKERRRREVVEIIKSKKTVNFEFDLDKL